MPSSPAPAPETPRVSSTGASPAGGPAERGDAPGRGGLAQSCLVRGAVALSLLLVVAAGLFALWWSQRPSLSEREVRQNVIATLQREAPSSFLVTGQLEATATSTVTNNKMLLPDWLNWNVGTTETTARVPGTIYYGFDVGALHPEDIRVGPGDTVTVTLPELSLHSIEPSLSQMRVRTQAGWTRLYDGSGDRTRDEALRVAEGALRKQGKAHLTDSQQPLYNTAEALETMLRPVLEAAGARDPVLRFRLGDEAVAAPIERPSG